MFELTEAQHSLWYKLILLLGIGFLIGVSAVESHQTRKEYEQYRQESEDRIFYLNELIDNMASSNRQANFVRRETECLAKNIYFEAAGESQSGKIAVAEVTRNRVRDGDFPKTYCGVVYQRQDNRCAFSWTCDGQPDQVRDMKTYRESLDIARNIVMRNKVYGVVDRDVMFYHAEYVRPYWSNKFERVKMIGQHVFYRGNNGNER